MDTQMADDSQPPPPFRPARSLGRAVMALLAAHVVLAWLALQAAYIFIQLVWHGLAGEFLPQSGLESHGNQFQTLRRLQAGAWMLTSALFLAWLYRAHENLLALKVTGLDYSPRWAVAGFFIPVLNLLRPFQVVREVWNASDPSQAGGAAWRVAGTPLWVAWWWVLFLLACLANLAVVGLAARARTPLDLGGAMPVLLVGQCLGMAAAVLAIVVVGRIDRYQEEKIGAIVASGGSHGR